MNGLFTMLCDGCRYEVQSDVECSYSTTVVWFLCKSNGKQMLSDKLCSCFQHLHEEPEADC